MIKKLIIPSLITILLSLLSTYYLFHWINAYSLDPKIQNIYSTSQVIKLFFTLFIYFFALITLPFLSKELIKWCKLKKEDWWKVIIGFEVFALVFAYIFSPPDMLSRIILFLPCQLIVVVNCMVIVRKQSR